MLIPVQIYGEGERESTWINMESEGHRFIISEAINPRKQVNIFSGERTKMQMIL